MITWHRVKAYLLRHLYEVQVSVDEKAGIVFFPVIDILIFGLLTVYLSKQNATPHLAGVLLGGIIFWTLVYNIQRDISFSLLQDAWSRNLYNLFSTPLRISEVIVADLLLSIAKALISIAVILAIAYWVFHFNLFAYGFPVAVYVFNVFLFGWAFGFFTASLIFRFGTKIQAFAWSLVLLIYPIAGVFYPLAVLPLALRFVARLLPVSYVFEGLRNAILTGRMMPGWNLLWVTGLSFVYLMVGIWFFVRGFRRARENGWFIHPT